MNDDSGRIPYKRDTTALHEQDIHQLEAGGWALLLLYDENGPQHADAQAWIEGIFDIAARIREVAIERASYKLLRLAQTFASEAMAHAQQFNAVMAYLKRTSGLVAVTGGMDALTPDDPRWKK